MTFKDNIAKLPESLLLDNGRINLRIIKGYLVAKHKYYIGDPIISDQEFDKLENTIREHYPECPIFEVVGMPEKDDYIKLHVWRETYDGSN